VDLSLGTTSPWVRGGERPALGMPQVDISEGVLDAEPNLPRRRGIESLGHIEAQQGPFDETEDGQVEA